MILPVPPVAGFVEVNADGVPDPQKLVFPAINPPSSEGLIVAVSGAEFAEIQPVEIFRAMA